MTMDDHRILRSRPVPAEVSRVEGCDCGGTVLHLTTCALWDLPPEQAQAAVDDAERRLREHVDELNRRLHAALGTFVKEEQ